MSAAESENHWSGRWGSRYGFSQGAALYSASGVMWRVVPGGSERSRDRSSFFGYLKEWMHLYGFPLGTVSAKWTDAQRAAGDRLLTLSGATVILGEDPIRKSGMESWWRPQCPVSTSGSLWERM